jgi:hypothetical protein
VLKGPLFPLNPVILHGLICAKLAQGLSSDPSTIDLAPFGMRAFESALGVQ